MKFLKIFFMKFFTKRKSRIYPYGFVVGRNMEKEFKSLNSMYCLWSSRLDDYSIGESFYVLNPKIDENIIVCKKEKGFFNPDSLIETIPTSKIHIAFASRYFVNESGWLISLDLPTKHHKAVSDDLNRVMYGVPPKKYDNSLFTKVSSAYAGKTVVKISDGEKALAVYTVLGDPLVFRESEPLSYDIWDINPLMKIFRKRSTLSKS
ncbi:MAG: hypothetical protein WD471_00010 [Candidatus Paceibacterota bacterium]